MFQFPWFASCTYGFSTRYPAYAGWVPPFRDLWITVCLPTPQSFSQATTSFIASDCQGIHRMRFFTWPYNPKQSGYCLNREDDIRRKFASWELQILPWPDQLPVKAINQSLLSHIQIFKERYSYRSKDQKSALNRLSLKRSFLNSLTLTATRESGGAKRDRTADLLRARQALSQLSYSPIRATSFKLQALSCNNKPKLGLVFFIFIIIQFVWILWTLPK